MQMKNKQTSACKFDADSNLFKTSRIIFRMQLSSLYLPLQYVVMAHQSDGSKITQLTL